MNYAMQTEKKSTTPSKDKGSVGLWILAPAISSFIFGGLMFAGGAMAWIANTDNRFIVGMWMFGAGCMGLLATVVKSWSFDKTGETSTSVATPIFYIPQTDAPQPMRGNVAVQSPTRNPHLVEFDGRKYNFTQGQMVHMANRYFRDGDNAPDFKITRDAANGRKVFTEWQNVKDIMLALDYWTVDSKGVFWTDGGGEWFEDHMRLLPPH